MDNNNILSIDKIWPQGMHNRIKQGFSDQELEMVCKPKISGFDDSLPYKYKIKLYWTVELYSFGKCYRDWLKLPNWAPLPMYGDHGVNLSGSLQEHEINSVPKTYLTWSKERFRSIDKNYNKKIIHIQHPWITYRKKYNIKKNDYASGTLIFHSHSNNGIEIVNYDWDKYFDKLLSLPEQFKPLIICMHMHDINKMYHIKLKKYGIPIISAGETSSPYFIDRFYSILCNFNYATSNKGGSELFYCEELGVKYFLMGERPIYYNFTHKQRPKGEMKPVDKVAEELINKKYHLFNEYPPRATKEKKLFVADILGLNITNKYTVYYRLIIEYISHTLIISKILLIMIIVRIKKWI